MSNQNYSLEAVKAQPSHHPLGLCPAEGQGSYPRINSILFSDDANTEGFRENRALWDWLVDNGYEKLAHAISSCSKELNKIGDSSFHSFYTLPSCGSPLCRICGFVNSPAHNRRKAMLYKKLDWAPALGNLTVTVPNSLKTIKDSEMFKLVRDFIMDHFSKFFLTVEAAELVFHPTGHKLTKHPHIQALFPIESGKGLIPKKRLRWLSKVYTKFVKRRYPDTDISMSMQVKYRYENSPQKKAHAIKYVTRLDFLTPSQFLALDDEIKHYIVSFRGHRLIRGIGRLSDRNWKTYVAEKTGKRVDGSLAQLDKGTCPICLEQLVFQKTLPSFLIDILGLKQIHPGYFCDGDTYEELRELYRSDYG